LNGTINPYLVAGTEAWFEWGNTCSLGFDTPRQPFPAEEAPLPVSATIEGLHPDETYCYQLAGTDKNLQSSERLVGKTETFKTLVVAPKVIGSPSASFITASSALLSAELNPENTNTEYYYEYAPSTGKGTNPLETCTSLKAGGCKGVSSTVALQSSIYGPIGASTEISSLQPNTVYDYRLTASNSAGENIPNKENEGTFETPGAPRVSAQTLTASAVTTNSALVTGTVTPDGQPGTYTFELGVYKGTSTQYTSILSASTGSSLTPEPESMLLTGLQPGTTYAYRIAITSGYGTATGTTNTFTTTPLAVLLPPPPAAAQLPIPAIRFPTPTSTPTCKHGYELDKKTDKCVKTKPKPKKKKTKQSKKKK
jgi:hypothetical protein